MRLLLTLLLLTTSLHAADSPKGTLVIVGGGKMPAAVREEFIAKAGGAAKAKIVVIPTASASADDPKEHASYLQQWKDAKVADVVLLHTRDAKTADADEFVKPLLDATGIWFSGGDQSKLTKAYAGTKVLDTIKKRYADGAVVGGTSAGAAVMSGLMITGGTDEATTADGFGLLPGTVVDQHFTQRKREKRLAGVIAKHPKLLGIGIDESTAVVVSGGTAKVIGDGKAFILTDKGDPLPLKAGESYDLSERKKR
ncbi:MAG: cyanophycinase [Fimbriiglobus sp.]|jgi:cyanophycinase|nr:cyanophycinase [Fimbriiglobus sp.]